MSKKIRFANASNFRLAHTNFFRGYTTHFAIKKIENMILHFIHPCEAKRNASLLEILFSDTIFFCRIGSLIGRKGGKCDK